VEKVPEYILATYVCIKKNCQSKLASIYEKFAQSCHPKVGSEDIYSDKTLRES
jgi:hypothetical protein